MPSIWLYYTLWFHGVARDYQWPQIWLMSMILVTRCRPNQTLNVCSVDVLTNLYHLIPARLVSHIIICQNMKIPCHPSFMMNHLKSIWICPDLEWYTVWLYNKTDFIIWLQDWLPDDIITATRCRLLVRRNSAMEETPRSWRYSAYSAVPL